MLSINYPLGLPLRSLSGTALNMGGVCVGVPNDHHVMLSNPGNLGTINKVAFSTLLLIDYLRINDYDSDLYTDHIDVRPMQISFALPLKYVGTLAFSLVKNSDAFIKYQQSKVLENKETYSQISFDRTGSLTSWQAGWGHKFGKFINAGVTYQRIYFTTSRTKLTDVIFTEGNGIESERDSTCLSFRANGFRLGFMGTIQNFTLGIAVNYIFEDNLLYRNAIYNENSSLVIDSSIISKSNSSMQIPPSVAVGASYIISPKWLIGSDITFDLWDNFTPQNNSIFYYFKSDNTVSFSAGVRFIPAPDLLVPKYWEIIHYSAGIQYTQLPGNKSQEIAGSIGFGLPLQGNGLLNIGMEYGKRSCGLYSNYDEKFLHIIIGINGGRKWHRSTHTSY